MGHMRFNNWKGLGDGSLPDVHFGVAYRRNEIFTEISP